MLGGGGGGRERDETSSTGSRFDKPNRCKSTLQEWDGCDLRLLAPPTGPVPLLSVVIYTQM